MIPYKHILSLLVLLSTLGCAQTRQTGLGFFEGQNAPVRWDRASGKAFKKIQVSTHVADNELQEDGSLLADYKNGPKLKLHGISGLEGLANLSVDRGFYTNLHFKNRLRERHVELFRGSTIISIFDRTTREPPEYLFSLDRLYTHMTYFVGYEKRTRPLSKLSLKSLDTVLPFVVLHDKAGANGIIIYFPHAPEWRRWYTEDYIVLETGEFVVEPAHKNGELLVRVQARIAHSRKEKENRMTYDAPLMIMPFETGVTPALEHFQLGSSAIDSSTSTQTVSRLDYWSQDVSGKAFTGMDIDLALMRRYAPDEFTSWMDSSLFSNGHEGGLAWGFTTMSMKAIRVDPLINRMLFRDHALRMLSFFVDAGKEKGAPPLLVEVDHWSRRFPSPELIYTVVFCQFWEFRLIEYRKLMRAPYVLEEEKNRVYEDLQRAKVVYDPKGKYSWSLPAGQNGLWFDYFDLPLKRVNPWIVNTHATSVNNAALLAELAIDMNRPDDIKYWKSIFERGVRGLLYATDQDWIWLEKDKNELKYGLHWNGPSSYHKYMVTTWLPEMLEHTQRLQPELYERLLALFRRCTKANLIQSDAGLRKLVDKISQKFGP